MAVATLNHAGMVVTDLEAAIAWWREHFGFREQYRYSIPEPSTEACFLVDTAGTRIEIFAPVGGASAAPKEQTDAAQLLSRRGLNHFALATADLEAMLAELQEKGVQVVFPPQMVPGSNGELFSFIRGPEDILIEIVQPSD